MGISPEHIDERARHAANQLRQATALDPPHFHDALSLARAGRAVALALGLALLVCASGAAVALSLVTGAMSLVWPAAVVVVALVVATSVVSAHAGGHAWFVPAPGAVLAAAWLVVATAGGHGATAWWLLTATGAMCAVAVVLAASLLRARVAARSVPLPTLVGAEGVVVSSLGPVGIARVRGETWTAESLSGHLPPGASVHVVRVDGLRLLVWSPEGQVPAADGLGLEPDEQREER